MRRARNARGFMSYFTLALVLSTNLHWCTFNDFYTASCDVGDLIDAINDANADPDWDRIILPNNCVYTLSEADNYYDLQGSQTGVDGANGLPVISTPITIEGSRSQIVRSEDPGTPEFRIFFVATGGELNLYGIYMENGLIQSASDSNDGGAVYIQYGVLRLRNSQVMHSTAAGLGGGIYNDMGTLQIDGSSMLFNNASSGGAIANNDGTLSIGFDHNTFSNNLAMEFGGAIFNSGILTISSSQFDDNQASLNGGAIACLSPGPGKASLNLEDADFNRNIAGQEGGALSISDDCAFDILDSRFTQNRASTGSGGAIHNDGDGMVSAGSQFDGNSSALQGGAIFNSLTGNLHIEDSNLSTNTAIDGSGGAMANYGDVVVRTSSIDSNIADKGGGIFNTGSISVENSTLSYNDGDGMYAYPVGIDGTTSSTDPYTYLVNTTISGNQGVHSGGIYAGGQWLIVHSTIAFNNCDAMGCGLQLESNTVELVIKNSLVVYNRPRDCDIGTGLNKITALGENLDSDFSCVGFTDTVLPLIGPLADNGGPTLTHALLPGSPALDLVTDCYVGGESMNWDQRGETRPSPPGGQCDVGAFELQGPTRPPLPPDTPTPEIPVQVPPTIPAPTPTCPVSRPC